MSTIGDYPPGCSQRDHDEYYDDDGAPPCERCGGEGWIIVCIDDMCRGVGECMHGDGEIVCPCGAAL